MIELSIVVDSERERVVSAQKISDSPIYGGRCSMDTDIIGAVAIKGSAKESPTG